MQLTKWIASTGANTPAYGYQYTNSLPLPTASLTPTLQWDDGLPTVWPSLPVIDLSLMNNKSVAYLDPRDNRPPMVENIGAEIE